MSLNDNFHNKLLLINNNTEKKLSTRLVNAKEDNKNLLNISNCSRTKAKEDNAEEDNINLLNISNQRLKVILVRN